MCCDFSLPAALPGHVSWRALHGEASQGCHGEVQEAAGGDNQHHQDKERREEPALLQHVPRQDSQQRRRLMSGRSSTAFPSMMKWLRQWPHEWPHHGFLANILTTTQYNVIFHLPDSFIASFLSITDHYRFVRISAWKRTNLPWFSKTSH